MGEDFVLPDPDTLKRFVDEARVQTMMNLLEKCRTGTASAAELQALLKAAKEVEAIIPENVLEQSRDSAQRRLENPPENVIMFAPEDTYDPEAPLHEQQQQ